MFIKTYSSIFFNSARTLLALAILAALSHGAKAAAVPEPNVTLANGESSSIVVAPGSLFSLNVVVTDTGGSQSLDSYDLQFSSDPTMVAPIPSGLTLQSFTDPFTNDFPSPSTSNASFSNLFLDPSDDATINSTPLPLVTANFRANTPGKYDIYFAPDPSVFQDLYAYDPDTENDNDFPFTQELDFSVTVTPEPSAEALGAVGLLLVLGWKLRRRRLVSV